MRNYQASKRLVVQKLAKTVDISTIFFQNINAALEKATTLNITCTTWNMIIRSIDFFQGLCKVTGSSLGSSVIRSLIGCCVISSPH